MADAETRAPKRRKKQTPSDGLLQNAALTCSLAAAGLIVSFALIWWQVLLQPRAGDAALRQTQLLSQYTQFFNGRIAELRNLVDAIATAPDTVSALANFDADAAKAATDAITAQNPHILRTALTLRDQAEVDLNATIPISFAALDLMRRAEVQEFVGPEVSLNQRNVIYAAQPVTNGGVVIGVLLVAFDSQFFLSPLSHYDTSVGVLEVVQAFAGAPDTVVMQWGRDQTGFEPQEAQLFAPHWTLRFSSDPENLLGPNNAMRIVMPATISLIVILAAIFLGFARYARQLRADANNLSDISSKVLRGRPARAAGFNLGILQEVANGMLPYAGEATNNEQSDANSTANSSDDARQVNARTKVAAKQAAAPSDEDFLEVSDSKTSADDNFGIEVSEETGPLAMGIEIDPTIFRAYDIRGITSTNLTGEVVYWIGRAFAAEARANGNSRMAVGWDGRNSSEELKENLVRGLSESGVDVTCVGQVPTPMLYYATHALDTGTGIMITGSHNPPEYNGLKMMIGGVTLAEERIQTLYQRIVDGDFGHADTTGDVDDIDLDDTYIDQITADVALAQPPKVVVDCGNGVAGKIAPRLLEEMGCEVIPLYCEVDGNFPNHHPDPAEPENLEDLITVVRAESADLGLAFDGDGDRVGVVTDQGEIIWPDKLVMLFAQDIVSRNPGADIIYDIKCSRHLNTLISDLGGRPIMWKTGHSHIKAKIKETGALLGGEFSGHICFAERWYGFDDALYSAARLLEIISADGRTTTELFDEYPKTFSTPELKIQTTEEDKFEIMGRLEVGGQFGEGTLTTIDGIRVDFADGWGLIRPSNTSPVLSLRFEADTPEALERIKGVFQEQLATIDPALTF